MFGRGNRRGEQAMTSWFPLWGDTRSAPQPTMTTQQTQLPSQLKPSAAAPCTPATEVPSSRTPASRPPPRSQPLAPPIGQKPTSATAPSLQAPQTTRSVAPQPQPRRQSPHKPTPPPHPVKIASKTEPQLQPASRVEPSRTVDLKSKPQPSPSATPVAIPVGPKPLPVSAVPSTLQQTEAKPDTAGQLASSKAPATSPVDSKPRPTSKTPANTTASQTEPIIKQKQPQGSSQAMTPSSSQVAAAAAPPQSQLTPKGTSMLRPTVSQLHPTATPIPSLGQPFHPKSHPSAGKPPNHIQGVGQPSLSSKPEESNHTEEPQPIPQVPADVPRSETKVEIVTLNLDADVQTRDDHKPEDKKKAEKPDSLDDPAILSAQRLSNVRTGVQQEKEKEKETTTFDKRAEPPPPPRHAARDAKGQETKTVVQVRQKDKHLESEIYQREKAPQGDEGVGRNIKERISRLPDKLGEAQKPHLQEDPDVRVITLAGENKGAHMDVSHGMKRKDGALHIYRDHKPNHGEKAEQSSDEEERENNFHDTTKPFMAYINNNTQSINNSIMYHSSCNNNNPGVHLSVTNNITTEPTRQHRRIVPVEVPDAQSQPRALFVQPTVRRRCLRSLFLESSDSDPENPDKPRRHGCRYGCPVQKTETSAAAAGSHVTNGHNK